MILLASASPTRRHLLQQAGIPFNSAVPKFDEEGCKAALKRAGADAAHLAEALAEGKAASLAEIHPDAIVIGADQLLECEGTCYDKPMDRAALCTQLLSLRGKTHRLITAAVLHVEGRIGWRHVDSAELTMRDFSDGFLESYLDSQGERALGSVGGYQLEGQGIQLFARIEGDYFTILGLPLLPLLEALRQAGALPS